MKSRHGGLAPKPRGTKVVRESCQLRVLSARRSNPGRSALPFRDHCYSRLHCKLDHGLASPFYPLVSSRPAQVATSSYLDWFLATRFLPPRKPPSIPFSLYFRYSYPPSLLPTFLQRNEPRCKDRAHDYALPPIRVETWQRKKANCFRRGSIYLATPSVFLRRFRDNCQIVFSRTWAESGKISSDFKRFRQFFFDLEIFRWDY